MANSVVYVPKNERWENLGKGIGEFFTKIAEVQQKKQQQVYANSVMQGINDTPDRAAAMQILAGATSNRMHPMTPQDITVFGGLIDAKHPKDEMTPQTFTGYNSTTGQPFDYILPKKDAAKALDKDVVSFVTGQDPNTFTVGAKPLTKEYVAPENGNMVGTFVPGMEPKGSITSDTWTRQEKLKADERAAKAGERQDAKLGLAIEAGNRAAAASGRAAGEVADIRREGAKEKAMTNFRQTLAETYNVKKYPDGTLDLSSLDENKRKQFSDALDKGLGLIDEGKAKNSGQAFRAVKDDLEKPTPKQEPANGGLPAGAKLGDETTVKTKDGKSVKARKVLDASGKVIGYSPL